MKAAQALGDPSTILSAFSVPGAFTLDIAGAQHRHPERDHGDRHQTSTLPTSRARTSRWGATTPLVSVGERPVSFPEFDGVGGEVTNLKVYSNGFSLGSAGFTIAPAGGISFGSLLQLNDLTVAIDNFSLTVTNGVATFGSTGPGGTSGITVSSSGVQFLPGQAVSGSITALPGDNDRRLGDVQLQQQRPAVVRLRRRQADDHARVGPLS